MKTFFISLIILSVTSCKHYNRIQDCHLDKLNIKGNVTKIETYTQSTMPLTELFYESYNPNNAINILGGNFELIFDNQGNIKQYKGYGIDFGMLFSTNKIEIEGASSSLPCIINKDIILSNYQLKTTISENGHIVNNKYYLDDELIYEQTASYDINGDLSTTILEYHTLNISYGPLSIKYADTTHFDYVEYDNHGNWTKVVVTNNSYKPADNYKYVEYRQITYCEDETKTPLIEQFKHKKAYTNEPQNTKFYTIEMDQYGKISIPEYMVEKSQNFKNELKKLMAENQPDDFIFLAHYKESNCYATITIEKYYVGVDNGFDDMPPYDKDYDYINEIQNEEYLNKCGTHTVKWIPYQFMDISGIKSAKLSYYRSGNGSPIPVYCESFTIPMNDGYSISIVLSFQSDQYDKFKNDFDKSIRSILIYK